MFRWSRIESFGLFWLKWLSSVKQLFMLSEQFWVKIVSFDILLRMSLKLVFSIIRVQEGPLHTPIDIILFQYNLKNYLSAVYHRSCLSLDLLHWHFWSLALTGSDVKVEDKFKVVCFTVFIQESVYVFCFHI